MIRKFCLTVFVITVFATINSFSQTSLSSSSSAISADFKAEEMKEFNYIITGLGSTTDASNLVALFKTRPGIVEAIADVPNHTITVFALLNMPETDILEILKFAGKTIIKNPKEVNKYYH